MTLNELLGRLRNVKGPTGKGEYVCQCPAHDDAHASLWVNEGSKGIILKCQAGCTKEQILRALGLSVYDLLDDRTRAEWDRRAARKGVDPRSLYDGSAPARSAAKKATAPPPPLKIHDVKTFDSYDAAYGHLGKLVCCYKYADAKGTTLFEVARIQTKEGKTFRQHRPANPNKGFWPIVCSVPVEVRGHVIYRLPEVNAAISAGKAVYVVEGEKDADTLAHFGRCATTSPMGADHWQRGHGEHLRGADVIVVPDADDSGEKYCQAVVDSVLGIARSVRVVKLRDAYSDLPNKGDITDLVELVGGDQAMEMLDDLIESAAPVEVNLYDKAVSIYQSMPGYCVENGCISKWSETTSRPLGTFVALPVAEITKDDGAMVTKWLEIAGWTIDGNPLPKQLVAMNKFKSMDWAMEGWGLTANIMPGNTVRDQLRSAIATAGAMTAKQKTIYTHVGWRKIKGKWCYLYQGGCIGAEDTTVEMEPGLTAYSLADVPTDLSPLDAAITSYSLTSVIKERVALPLLAMMYLSPLREFLARAGNPPAFILMLRGASGTRKSTVAALALSHFGQFEDSTPPSSFMDTANSVRRKAFVLKDMPLLIDDYHPTTSLQERRKLDSVVQTLSRTFGNLAARGRMAADLTIQVSMPARCLAIMTGEETPNIGDSGVARFYEIELNRDDVPASDALTALQQRARAGELRAAMNGYIQWLLTQADDLPRRLGEMFIDYRSRAMREFGEINVHGRSAGACAQLMIGLTYMLEYFKTLGMCDNEMAETLLDGYWKTIVGISAEQMRSNKDESAVQMFLTAVSEMLASKTIAVMDITPGVERSTPIRGMAGYVDTLNYYFMGETVYGAVVHFYRDQDRVFPASRAALFKMLKEQNVVQQVGGDGKMTRIKRTPDGKRQRLLWIPRWVLDGGEQPDPESVQMEMGFTEVSAEEIPDEFK